MNELKMQEDNAEIQALKYKLMISEKRYQIAIGFSDITVFDYDVATKKITTQPSDFEIFGMPGVLDDGVEEIIKSGVIAKRSHNDIRTLYEKIDNGDPSAKVTIFANALDGSERVIEIILVTIFDQNNKPTHAVGVRKDITDSLMLKKEKEYNCLFMSGWSFTYEANVTCDTLVRYDYAWVEEMKFLDTSSFSGLIKSICDNFVAPESADIIISTLNRNSIISAYENSKKLISFEYRKKTNDGNYMWFEQNINIIKDEISGDINIRCYIKNIHKQKEKEMKLLEEQQFYETMVSKSDIIYEINMTENLFLKGHENWNNLFGVKVTGNYTEMIASFIEKAVHPDDREIFQATHMRLNVLDAHNRGDNYLNCEYRRWNSFEEFAWFRSTTHIFEDLNSGDVKSFAYVANIDTEKKKELELIYKSQHDLLTNLYNKITLEEKIIDYLDTSDAKIGMHAFLILDLDNFKAINDNFGHAFGDVFLSRTASKIRSLFRDEDILGRIGGDEFVIFMKNIQNINAINIKAKELCSSLTETYTRDNVSYNVTVSIGIAVYNIHGKSYTELYHHSDIALYQSKENGRDMFSIYNDNMQFGLTAINGGIESSKLLQTKIFEGNVNEYVFRILYETADRKSAINSILELVGKHYATNRVYIFENSSDGLSTNNTFEWCSAGTTSQIDIMQNIKFGFIGDYKMNFNDNGFFFMPDIEKAAPALREILTPRDVKSMLQFSIVKNNIFVGFIGLDQCDHLRVATQNELSECRNMANVLGVFITEMRAIEESESLKQMALSIVNGLGSYAYVCDPDTHKVLFINEKLREFVPTAEIGDICYKTFWGVSSPCEYCPMKTLTEKSSLNFTSEMFNTNLNIWVKVTTSWINWLGDKKKCLVESVDITKYITNAANTELYDPDINANISTQTLEVNK